MSYNRRTDREYREVGRTFLSVVLSGTPAQVAPLIPSAENGLFSRELFYYMPAVHEWRDQFGAAEVDADLEFTRMGRQWKRVADDLKRRGVFTLRLSPGQREAFNKHFSRLFRRAGLVNRQEMNSSVVRLAINSLRILEVVAMLRALERPELQRPDARTASDNLKDGIIARWDVTAVPEDFEAVLSLSEPLYVHATHILSFLPATEVKRRSLSDRDRLLAARPDVFTYRQWLDAADREGIPKNTAKSWLQRLIAGGAVARTEEQGVYHKHDS